MSRIYYHNITKGILNESDLQDLLNQSDPHDQFYFCEEGRGLLFPVDGKHKDEDDGEYDYVRKEFKKAFRDRDWITESKSIFVIMDEMVKNDEDIYSYNQSGSMLQNYGNLQALSFKITKDIYEKLLYKSSKYITFCYVLNKEQYLNRKR